MVHFPPAFAAGVDHDTESAIGIRGCSPVPSPAWEPAPSCDPAGAHPRRRPGPWRGCASGNHQEVHGRTRVNVMEGEQLLVFIDLSRRNLAPWRCGRKMQWGSWWSCMVSCISTVQYSRRPALSHGPWRPSPEAGNARRPCGDYPPYSR